MYTVQYIISGLALLIVFVLPNYVFSCDHVLDLGKLLTTSCLVTYEDIYILQHAFYEPEIFG